MGMGFCHVTNERAEIVSNMLTRFDSVKLGGPISSEECFYDSN